jgi:hypothetical protein
MNILIASCPRSRTTFFSDVLSQEFNLQNLHEKLETHGEIQNVYQNAKMTRKSNIQELVMNRKNNLIKQIIEGVLSTDNNILKFFPRHLVCNFNTLGSNDENKYQHGYIENVNNLNYQIITNISETLQLEKFDKIYILNRNLLDLSISYAYSAMTKNFLFLNRIQYEYVRKKYNRVTIDTTNMAYINFIVFEYVLFEKIKTLILNKYNVIELDYDSIPNYLSSINTDYKTEYINSEFDYNKIITNFSECEVHIKNLYSLYTNTLSRYNFT